MKRKKPNNTFDEFWKNKIKTDSVSYVKDIRKE